MTHSPQGGPRSMARIIQRGRFAALYCVSWHVCMKRGHFDPTTRVESQHDAPRRIPCRRTIYFGPMILISCPSTRETKFRDCPSSHADGADGAAPHRGASLAFTVPIVLACSSLYLAIRVSFSDSPRGSCVVHCTVSVPNSCMLVKFCCHHWRRIRTVSILA